MVPGLRRPFLDRFYTTFIPSFWGPLPDTPEPFFFYNFTPYVLGVPKNIFLAFFEIPYFWACKGT